AETSRALRRRRGGSFRGDVPFGGDSGAPSAETRGALPRRRGGPFRANAVGPFRGDIEGTFRADIGAASADTSEPTVRSGLCRRVVERIDLRILREVGPWSGPDDDRLLVEV